MQRMGTMSMMSVTMLLGGDVMTGRGIDQVLPHPSPPVLYEHYVSDAGTYVRLAEGAHGTIPRRADPSSLWGDALGELARAAPDVRIVNLETAITRSGEPWPGKGINYRMHPANIGALTSAAIDLVVLANNHVLDWGYRGLTETIGTLEAAEIRHAGAGQDDAEAASPAVLDLGPERGRVVVFSAAHGSSGVPSSWAAGPDRPGVNLLPDLSDMTADRVAESVRKVKRPGDVVVLSVHWGENWGYEVPEEQVRFSRRVIDAGVDVVHGHSSHHVKPIEVYRGRLILYGCGDLLNDYEGIEGHEAYRGDLALLFLARTDASGRLRDLEMVPFQVRRFRLNRAVAADVRWLADLLSREGGRFGTAVVVTPDLRLRLRGTE